MIDVDTDGASYVTVAEAARLLSALGYLMIALSSMAKVV